MNKMMETANTLDRVLNVLEIFIKIGLVIVIVVSLILGALAIFNVDPAIYGEVDYTVYIGDLEFELAENCAPEAKQMVWLELAGTVISIPVIFIGWLALKALRKIVQAMAQGTPFHADVSGQIKKLALYQVLIGVIGNAAEAATLMLLYHGYNMKLLFLSEKILSVSFSNEFDLTFLIVAGILLLLSYVFAYGEQLQNLSDETL